MSNKLVLGTVQFGLNYGIANKYGQPDFETVKEILDKAYDNQIKFLDSAEAYGNAHDIIGTYHRSVSHRFEIITKFSKSRNDLSSDLEKRIESVLRTLEVESLYAYMFHSFSDFMKYYSLYKGEIKKLKNKGLIKKFGVSVYTNQEFEELLAFEDIDLIQLPFNLLDNNFQRYKHIKKAKQRNIEIHTRSVFLQGLFFLDKEKIPEKLNPLIKYLQIIENLCARKTLNINDMALNYAVRQDLIDRVLVGVDSVEQLEINLQSLQAHIPSDAMNQIDTIEVTETELLNPANWNK